MKNENHESTEKSGNLGSIKDETPSLFSNDYQEDKESKDIKIEEAVKDTQKHIYNIPVPESKPKKLIDKRDKTKIPKGDFLEYRLKRLVFYMGYFTKVGVIIKTSQEEPSDMITDLDVFGVYIHKDFSNKTIWVDCKSGQARPLERISWLKGVMDLIYANDVIFVKGGVRQSTKEFARKSGIQILDLNIIEKLERNYGIKPNDWRGSWNPYKQLGKLTVFQKINIPTNDPYSKIGNFISSSYWSLDNYTRIKKTVTALRDLSNITQLTLNEEQTNAIKWAIYELVTLFVLALFNITNELYYFSDPEKKDTLSNALISSEISAKKRSELINATFKIAYSLVQQQNPEFIAPTQAPNLNLTPPNYFDALYDLILRISKNPLQYYDILRFLDFVLMEYDLQSKKINDIEIKQIFGNYDEMIIGSKTILHFITEITGVARQYFQLIQ